MLLSHTNASPPQFQINRLYIACIAFFQVTYHPDGVGEGREESSSKTITWDGGGVLTVLPPVSLSFRAPPAALPLQSLQPVLPWPPLPDLAFPAPHDTRPHQSDSVPFAVSVVPRARETIAPSLASTEPDSQWQQCVWSCPGWRAQRQAWVLRCGCFSRFFLRRIL